MQENKLKTITSLSIKSEKKNNLNDWQENNEID
jgi:hypothetical protein